MGSSIVVAGQRFDIDHPVVTFEDSAGYNAYLKHRTDDPSQLYPTHPAAGMEKKEGRYRERHTLEARTLTALKRTVRQVVVHLDGCLHSKMCFDVLHNQHGLSVHFLVDNDGTTAHVRLLGAQQETYTLTLVQEDGAWHVRIPVP